MAKKKTSAKPPAKIKKPVDPILKLKIPQRTINSRLTERICNHIKTGVHIETACATVGITVQTLRLWLSRASAALAKPPEELTSADLLYIEFAEQTHFAAGTASARMARNVKRAGDSGDWRASAWLLEHFDEHFGVKKYKHEHTGQVNHAHAHVHSHYEVDVNELPIEMVERIYRKMKEDDAKEFQIPDREGGSEHAKLL